MKISPALFGFEESTQISPANVDRLVEEMLGHYRTVQAINEVEGVPRLGSPSFSTQLNRKTALTRVDLNRKDSA
jgi:hypothetical protein